MTVDPQLAALAAAWGVATAYRDHLHRPVEVPAASVRLALAAMGVAADSPATTRASLGRVRAEAAARTLPPSVV
ncbi:MAG: 4-alpha-glucanotransferase, partial [Egibacteraceae bacterium]